MKTTLKMENIKVELGDTIKGMIGKAEAKINLSPSENDKTIPAIHTDFYIDSTGVSAIGNFVGIKEGIYNFDLVREAPKIWPLTGYIAFKYLYAYTPAFPLLMKMPETKLTIGHDEIELNGARLEMGHSDLEATGKIYNLRKAVLEKKELRAELSLKADTIDCNELIRTINAGEFKYSDEELVQITESESPADTTAMSTFVVPPGIDFTFSSKINHVLLGDMEISDVAGLITIKDQNIHLANLELKTKASNMQTNMRYEAKDSTSAYMNFDFNLTDIDIENLIDLMPALDTLFPMANSFEGLVNFRIQGESSLDDKMGIVVPTLKAVSSIKGINLVVLDGETFSKLSKTLMFKNKEKNKIDSLSFEIMIDGSVI